MGLSRIWLQQRHKEAQMTREEVARVEKLIEEADPQISISEKYAGS